MDYISPYATQCLNHSLHKNYIIDDDLSDIFESLFVSISISGRFKTVRGNRGNEKWICCTDGCSHSISFSLHCIVSKINGKIVHDDAIIHKHGSDICWHSSNDCKTKVIEFELKEKALIAGASAIPKMFEDKQLSLKKSGMSECDIAAVMPQYQSFKSTMYRAKGKSYPRIPHILSDLDFTSDLSKVYRETVASVVDNVPVPGKRFLLFDGYQEVIRNRQVKCRDRITIFTSDYGLKLLSQATKIGADGTFNSCPALYSQAYIIMAWFRGQCDTTTF
jgi:hypothetical protein